MSIEDRNLKPGTVLVARYKKRDHRCTVVKGEDGKLVYRVHGGKDYTSPSAAGTAVMGGVACNGWRFWTVEGTEAKKAKGAATPKAAAKPKAATKPTKPATRAKKAPKAAKRATSAKKVTGGSNGADQEPVEKPVSCGDCGQEFPTSREAGDHMRDAHGSAEAAGSGGR
jgi:hypothetical protein